MKIEYKLITIFIVLSKVWHRFRFIIKIAVSCASKFILNLVNVVFELCLNIFLENQFCFMQMYEKSIFNLEHLINIWKEHTQIHVCVWDRWIECDLYKLLIRHNCDLRFFLCTCLFIASFLIVWFCIWFQHCIHIWRAYTEPCLYLAQVRRFQHDFQIFD